MKVAFGQSNTCGKGIGYNVSVLSVDSQMVVAFGYYVSKYSNGTLIQYHRSGTLYGTGNYSIETSNNNPNECYETINWFTGPNAGQTQCTTSSSTMDGHGSISCFGFNTTCPKECTPDFVLIPYHGFSGSFVLNPLSDDPMHINKHKE